MLSDTIYVIPFFSFKHAQVHVYSSVNQVFHQDFVKDIQGENPKTLWTLRNDDNFYFTGERSIFNGTSNPVNQPHLLQTLLRVTMM
jgi:hypothetical protein